MDLQEAEKSLDKVLEHYKQHGITLSYRPKIEYVDDVYPFLRDAVAMVRPESLFLENLKERLDKLYPEGLSQPWQDVYDLEVSSEALSEFNDAIVSHLQSRVETTKIDNPFEDTDADIIFFKTYDAQPNRPNLLEEFLSHEVWHLIELEQGVYEKNIFITEGTATYASMIYTGIITETPIEGSENLMSILYQGAASVVHNHIGSSDNPYQAMLDPNIRKSIDKEFLDKLRPKVINLAKKTLEDENRAKSLAYVFELLPEFEPLRHNVTPENLLEVYRDLGATKLAAELEGQNMDKLVGWYKLIFPQQPPTSIYPDNP